MVSQHALVGQPYVGKHRLVIVRHVILQPEFGLRKRLKKDEAVSKPIGFDTASIFHTKNFYWTAIVISKTDFIEYVSDRQHQ